MRGRQGARLALSEAESTELQQLKLQTLRQGRAVGAVIGFFLKLRPYPMLEEIRARGKLFQPVFGPVLVVDGETVRGVLDRAQEFTVEPYGRGSAARVSEDAVRWNT